MTPVPAVWFSRLRDRLSPEIRCESAAVRMPAGFVQLRALRRDDGERWCALRRNDEALLRPVEPTATPSWEKVHSLHNWNHLYDRLYDGATTGEILPLAIDYERQFIGQLTLGNIQHGATRDCWIGYWVHSSFTGKSLATVAVGLGLDLAFRQVRMHRVTATVMPHNLASRRVLEKNRFRHEGFLQRCISIDGQWADHDLFAITADEVTPRPLEFLLQQGVVHEVIDPFS